MTVVNPKSISGINSITTGSGSDDILTIHTNNGTERLRIDSTGTTKIVTGIVTTLTATTGIVTTFEATTGNITTLRAPTGIVTTFEATTGNITTLRAPTGIVTTLTATTGIVTTFTADTARINTTSLASTKLSIQSTATSGSGSACGLRVGNNVSGALTKYPAEVEIRTTGVQDFNALRTDAGDGNGGFTAGVQGYNGFLNLTTGGTDVVGVKFSADANTNFFNGSTGLNANVGIGTTVVTSGSNLSLGRKDTSIEGGDLGFCRANDGTQYWHMDCYGSDDNPQLRFHNSGSTKVTFLGAGGITFNGESTQAHALDDYEEGTWTVGLTFGGGNTGITFQYNTGKYIKIGGIVVAKFGIRLSNKGSSTGNARITGLPVAGVHGAYYHDVGALVTIDGGADTTGGHTNCFVTDSTKLALRQGSFGNQNRDSTDTMFNNNTALFGTIVYNTIA